MPFFAVQENERSSDENQKSKLFLLHLFRVNSWLPFLQFERKETFTMTSYPEAVDHVNDFDEMLHFIIKATASLVSTRATIIHAIITEKKLSSEKWNAQTYHEMILCKVEQFWA